MEFINRQKLYTILLVITTGILVLLQIGFNYQTLKEQRISNQIWQDYVSQENQIHLSLNQLYQVMGFEGFIHHYKNYLIRQTPGDLDHLKLDARKVRAELSHLNSLLNHPEELVALDQLDYIFSRYIGQIDEITRQIELKTPIQKIDRLLLIHEPTALLALDVLNESIQRRLQTTRAQAEKQLLHADNLSLVNFIIVIPLIALLTYLFWLMRRSGETLIELHQANTQINQLLDMTPDPMLFVNFEGKIVRANVSASDFFGYSNFQLSQMQMEQLLPEELRAKHVFLRSQFKIPNKPHAMNQGRPVSVQLANQSIASVQIHLSFWEHETSPLIIASLRDVTQELQDREKLRQSHQELANTVQKLQHVTHQLAESEKMAALGTLVAGVSHEINTPLGVSLTAITHIHDKTEELKTDFAKDALTFEQLDEFLSTQLESTELITRNLQHAATMINNFKQVAIDQSQNELREVNLCSYINETLSSLKPSFKHRHIEIRFDCESSQLIASYPGAISQVINNLVMNCVQHAFEEDKGGIITIQALFDNHADTVILRISDNGKGIEPETQPHIFEPFFTTARAKGGSGLGLNIVYNLITQLLQGEIKVQSELGHGTEIFVTLPLKLLPKEAKLSSSLLFNLKTPNISSN